MDEILYIVQSKEKTNGHFLKTTLDQMRLAEKVLRLYTDPLMSVKGFEEYQQKIREANLIENIEETKKSIFASKWKHKECLSLYVLFSWRPLHCEFNPT